VPDRIELEPLEGSPTAGLLESAAEHGPRELPESIGRFLVRSEIGRGGIGVVYRVHDPELGRDLALKVLLPRFRGNMDACQRFVEESQIGGQLQHPGIVPVHEMGMGSWSTPPGALRTSGSGGR
jgi:serine/threonine protein kinase